MQYTDVQNIAKKTMEFIKDNIKPGITLPEIRILCETKMMELGADSFWYWDVGHLFLPEMKPRYLFQEKNILQANESLKKMTLLQLI